MFVLLFILVVSRFLTKAPVFLAHEFIYLQMFYQSFSNAYLFYNCWLLSRVIASHLQLLFE